MSYTIPQLKRSAVSAALSAALLMTSGAAFADLVFAPSISVQGSGLGAVNTLVTAADMRGVESGCVSSSGGAAFNFACLNGLQGGDNQATNSTRLLSTVSSTTAGDLALVVNVAEPGQDLTVILTDLYLSLYGLGGDLLGNYQYTGADLSLTQSTAAGIGGSGFVFVLDAAQQALANAACPVLTNCFAGGGFQFASGSTNGAPETLYITSVVNAPAPGPVPIPEPASLALVCLGLLGTAAAIRKRRV